MAKGTIRFNDDGSTFQDVTRNEHLLETNQEYVIPAEGYRRWDDFAVSLPKTPTADDLGIVTGALATDFPTPQTGDVKTTTIAMYLGFTFALPVEYLAGGLITIRSSVGMLTTISDGTALIDFQAYVNDGDSTSGSDLVTTSPINMNSVTFGNKDFSINPASRNPGDQLLIRAHVAIVDTATGTAVIGCIGKLTMLLSIKG